MFRLVCLITTLLCVFVTSSSIFRVSVDEDNAETVLPDISSNFIHESQKEVLPIESQKEVLPIESRKEALPIVTYEEALPIMTYEEVLPIVIWHGMGDTCCEEDSMGRVKKAVESKLPSAYVVSLMIGKNEKADFTNSYLLDVNEQIDIACNMIRGDKRLKNGYNALGFSQGGQFFRAIAQRCPTPRINYLLTFGSQHQGVYGIPKCPGEGAVICNFGRKLFNYGVYSDFVQSHLVQAQYWHDPIDEETYVNRSTFIAEINNEKVYREEYKDNLLKLNKFVMVQFTDDNVVDPQESSSFGYFLPGQAKVVVPMRMTRVYTENLIGLKELDESGRLEFIRVPGNHLRFNLSWFETAIIDKYLR